MNVWTNDGSQTARAFRESLSDASEGTTFHVLAFVCEIGVLDAFSTCVWDCDSFELEPSTGITWCPGGTSGSVRLSPGCRAVELSRIRLSSSFPRGAVEALPVEFLCRACRQACRGLTRRLHMGSKGVFQVFCRGLSRSVEVCRGLSSYPVE